MKTLYLAIKQQLQATISSDGTYDPSFDESFAGGTPIEVYQWNRKQFNSLIGPKNEGLPQNTPSIMIEFANTKPAQLGIKGNKVYDDLQVRVHIVYRQEAPADGSEPEESLEVFPFSESVRKSLENWYSGAVGVNGSGIFTWNDEHEDDSYSNVYHLIHEYGTTWVDSVTALPVDPNDPVEVPAQTVPQPITPEITTVYDPKPFQKPLP